MSEKSPAVDLDEILMKIGTGNHRYEIKNNFFIIVPILFASMYTLSYLFTTKNLNYRCLVPECDSTINPEYNPIWISKAVPISNHLPRRCHKFASNSITNQTNNNNNCASDYFNQSVIGICHEFVFDTNKTTILNDFDLECDENVWKLTLVGTISSIGYFIGLSIAGQISDRFGRRVVMLGGLTLSSLMGTLRSFAPSYYWFLVFEFLDTFMGAGAYDSGFILSVELVPPDKRVLVSTIISLCYPFGEMAVGLIAWCTDSWRNLLRFIYIPGFSMLLFFWITPESLKWLLAKQKHEQVKEILRRAAKLNKVELSEDDLNQLQNSNISEKETTTPKHSLKEVFKSRILLLRLLNCSFCWVTCSFVYSGLSINTSTIAGNYYLNYILISMIEIPGYFATYFILDRFGRRMSLCSSLLLCGIVCLTFMFISTETEWLGLAVFLIGKFGITISYTVIYVLITEIFPTPLRHSLLGTCSMFGSLGSMIAPQTLLLAELSESLPLIIFGAMAVLAGIFVLFLPETLNVKLPDTIEEAENIGQKAVFNTYM